MNHPTPQQLADLNEGLLDEAEAASVSLHLDECTACRALVASQGETRGSLLRQLAAPASDAFHAEPERESALRQAIALADGRANSPLGSVAPKVEFRGPPADEYEMLEQIGAGGMGHVFKARHRRMNRIVAIKTLPDVNSPDAARRFHREIEAAARLNHSNIVIAHDAGESNGLHYLVMEFVDGRDLSAVVRRDGPLAVAQAVDYCKQAARGLTHAHAAGIVHRDIKPSNLLVDREGVVKVLDLGLARLNTAAPQTAPGELTQAGQLMGTVDYMAPEQAIDVSRADAKADVYSLGCTLYRLLTGVPPYAGDTVLKKIVAHREAPIPSLCAARPDVPAALDQLFARMIAKRPEDRPTMAEVATALETWQTPGRKTAAAGGRRRLRAAGAIVALPLIAAGIWLAFGERFGRRSDPEQPNVATAAILRFTPTGEPPPPAVAPFDAPQARVHQEAWAKHLNVPVEFTNSIGSRLVFIPPGAFQMGSLNDEPERGAEETLHDVRLTRPFYLAAHEVTQEEYVRVVGSNPSAFSKTSAGNPLFKDRVADIDTGRFPVEGVSLSDAVMYCKLLSRLPDEAAAGRTYRLPTEAEWEYACRAGTTTPFHYGNALDGRLANFSSDAPYGTTDNGPNLKRPAVVGSYAPNAWGLFDMHGNMAEWCGDLFDRRYYAVSPQLDPTGPADGHEHVIRGGSWGGRGSVCRSAARMGNPSIGRTNIIGLRVVCEPAALR